MREDVATRAVVRDERAFAEWAAHAYPDETEPAFVITGSEKEVAEFLCVADARHLFRRVTVVSSELRRKVLAASREHGFPVAPDGETDVRGVVVEKSGGRVRCQAGPDGGKAALEAFADSDLLFELLLDADRPGGAA